jgi:cytochrome c oxidase subunit 2
MYLKSRDVIHSVFFPNIRLKQDIMPGRTIPSWFEAIESNTKMVEVDGKKVWEDGWRLDGTNWVKDKNSIFDLVCTQYCGTRHSLMRGKLYVHDTKEDFLAWLTNANELQNIRQATPTSVNASP